MGTVAVSGFSTFWQTCAALFVAFACWLFTTLVAGAYVTVFEPSGLTLWTLAVAGWCGVFFARNACAFLFPHYVPQAIFFLFVVASPLSPILGYLSDAAALEQAGRLAQTLATLATAYALFVQRDDASLAGSTHEA